MRVLWAVVLAVLAVPAVAEEHRGLVLGADVFRAGATVVHAAEGAGDVFLAGERVRIDAAVDGAAHVAARRVEVAAPVAGNLYAAGMDVAVAAPVAGAATLAGYDVLVEAEVDGGLRATGATVRVMAPVGGPAALGGREVVVAAPIAGDVALAADRLSFGAEATIGGRLVLFGDAEQAAAIPAGVVPADRIEVRERREREERLVGPPPAVGVAGSFVGSVIVLTLLATLAAAMAPVGIEVLRDEASERPFRTLGLGFLTLSALIGSAVVVALTLIGLVVAPAILVAAVLLGLAGYVVVVYMIGASLLEWWRRGEPASLGQRALAALIGAAVASIVFLVPVLGWLFMLAAVLMGLGALARAAWRPRTA